jgi:hypothetical protein
MIVKWRFLTPEKDGPAASVLSQGGKFRSDLMVWMPLTALPDDC